jgi:hypothetical protein
MYFSLILAAIPAVGGANTAVMQIRSEADIALPSKPYSFSKAMSNNPLDIHGLKKATRYKVCQSFTDFYHNLFAEGEILTFVEVQFLPYHGGYTLVFKKRNPYLQEDENAKMLNSLGDYLSLSGEK